MTLPSYANSETKPRCWVTLGLRPLCIEIGMEDWWVGNLVIIYKSTEDVCPINVPNKISFSFVSILQGMKDVLFVSELFSMKV